MKWSETSSSKDESLQKIYPELYGKIEQTERTIMANMRKANFDLVTEQTRMFERKLAKRDSTSYKNEVLELFTTDTDDSVSPYIST